MIITISATLTEEQAIILAWRMWYSETITRISNPLIKPEVFEEIKNPQTPWEFIKEVYEKMIANDTAKHFIAYNDEQKQAIRAEEDRAIRDEIQANITSQVI